MNSQISYIFNEAKRHHLFFWRDSAGNEVDVIMEQATGLVPIEIKSGQTITPAYFKGLVFCQIYRFIGLDFFKNELFIGLEKLSLCRVEQQKAQL